MIPARIHNEEPGDDVRRSLGVIERSIFDCVYSRHHNGRVRERAIRRLLLSEQNFSWTVPYAVRLLGEYVVEIAAAIDTMLPLDWDSAREASFGKFAAMNPKFVALTEARATSYWALRAERTRL
ncbi:MAG: hypothetical protein GXP35_12200 [Actinobacteria bacterium]|nr:hypothetical protein [Actinomycetota bacterium]